MKNRWNSQIHTVVRRAVDGVPTYVVRNDNNGSESVFHRACLLLWIAGQPDQTDGVRSNPVIAVLNALGSVGEDTSVKDEVSQDLNYGLSLAMFRTIVDLPHHKTSLDATAPKTGAVPEGAGHVTSDEGGQACNDWRYRPGRRCSTMMGLIGKGPTKSSHHLGVCNRRVCHHRAPSAFQHAGGAL